MRRALTIAVIAMLSGCDMTTVPPSLSASPVSSDTGSGEPRNFSEERYCQGMLPPTAVHVVARDAAVSESNERNISSLTFSHPDYHAGQVILGLTETSFKLDMNADLVTRSLPDTGEPCSRVSVDVVVSMSFHVVNVARELKPGTCAYNKVRDHEYRHVAVNRETLYTAASVLEQEMKDFFGQRVYYGNPAKLRQELRVAIETHWMPRLQELKAAGLANHLAVDTVEEYASINTDCDGEIPALLQSDSELKALLETTTPSE